jgi:hypothetical protein
MTTTTIAEVRDEIVRRIRDLIPLVHERTRWIEYRGDLEFRTAMSKNPGGCERKFIVRSSGAVQPPDVSDGVRERVRTELEVVIALPATWRQGKHLIDVDDVLESDLAQLDQEVGTNGFATYATTTPAATVMSNEPTRREEDLPGVVFGVLPLQVVFWRAQP